MAKNMRAKVSSLPPAGLEQLQRAGLPTAGNQGEPGTGVISLGPDRMRLLTIQMGLRMESGTRPDGSQGVKMRLPLFPRAGHLHSSRRRAPSALSIAKKEFGIKARTAKDALPLFENLLVQYGVIQADQRTPVQP